MHYLENKRLYFEILNIEQNLKKLINIFILFYKIKIIKI